jgi:hypothetical protein
VSSNADELATRRWGEKETCFTGSKNSTLDAAGDRDAGKGKGQIVTSYSTFQRACNKLRARRTTTALLPVALQKGGAELERRARLQATAD